MDLSTRACLPLPDIKRDGRQGEVQRTGERGSGRSSTMELVGVDRRWDGSAMCHRGVRRGRQAWAGGSQSQRSSRRPCSQIGHARCQKKGVSRLPRTENRGCQATMHLSPA
ncbi:hypothetical protein TESG_05889 [Trichophyton tonsurans CBS 112818]|uniref:Uncharacterized protein n=2 Tax=Trichophyton TaxID=5550 RepID=F2PJQ6_TRIEC|nr:hypothetical protein TESG_05889 [Trichophyton tonsurans CBS 112818]EGE02124.1 hypothetical protein TEQG_01163 [Trichophyton equinum CBS 127.97]